MKKLLLTALIAVSIVSSAFASDVTKVNSRVLNAFNAQYGNVANVEWAMKPEFIKASFIEDEKKVEVFYNYTGEKIGSSSLIEIAQLPTSAKRAFAKKYAGYTLKEAIQFEADNNLSYFVTAANDKESLILEINGGLVSIYKRLK